MSRRLNRRWFLWAGAALGGSLAAAPRSEPETVYHFAAGSCDLRLSVEFFDNYSSNGFWFKDQTANRRFCIAINGDENHDCLPGFIGSLAIARYHLQPRGKSFEAFSLTEHVRTIDEDNRVTRRPPFERTIEFRDGIASDIQAFGYDTAAAQAARQPGMPKNPWCLLRQDLYLEEKDSPALVIHWKHSLSAIRLLDVIPGDQTQVISEPDSSKRRKK
jgi:hypothetical protein